MSSHRRGPGLGAAKRPRSAHMTTTHTMPSTPLQNLKGHTIEPAHVSAVARSPMMASGTSRQTNNHRHPVHPESPSGAVLRPRSAFPGKSSACERSEANEAFLFRQRMSAHASATSAHRKSRVSRPESAPTRDRRASQSSFSSRGQQYARSKHREEETAGSRLTQYLTSLELRSVGSPSSSLRPAASSSYSKTSSDSETSSLSPKIPLYTWGSNYYGQCSGTAGKDVASPHSCDHILENADVGGADMNDCVDRVYCSDKYTVAVCAGGGKVVCWGKPFGVQTDGTVLKVPSALVMGIPRVTELSCGQDHAVALLEGGLLVGWGSQASGALGPLDSLAQPSGPAMAVPLHRFMEIAPRIVGVCCGARFTLVLTNHGDIYGAGDNEFGQLGAGKASKSTCFAPVRMELPPSTSPSQEGPTIKQLACGDRHALVLTQGGLIWATGLSGCRSIADEERGELRDVSSQPQPLAIDVKTKVVSIDAAGHWSCATLGDGGIFAWDAVCSSPIPLRTMRDKGASMRQAVITSSGSVVAVSYACNVYEWTNVRAAREPLVRSQFASQGVKVNFVAAGGGHFAAARLKHPGLRTFRFDPRPVEATVPCARASIIWGGGISKAVASRRASGQNEFQIQLKSKEGKIFTPRAEADAPEIHAGLWKDAACSHRIADADIRVRHIGKGRYMVSYGATQAGEMYMSVRLGGVHVGKSPYKVTNSPGSLHVASCVCSFLDAQQTVSIEERDSFGNRVQRPETGRAWTVQAYNADRDTMLWRGLPGARIPLLPGLSYIEVLHNDSQTVLQCQGGTLNQHSDNSSFCSQYQATLQHHMLLEGGEAVIRWVRPLECGGMLRISFTFRDGQSSIVEVAVREGMEEAHFTVPAISGGFAVFCALYTMILQHETAFPFMKPIPNVCILSQCAQSFATKRSLGANERIRSGFFFCKELQTDLSSPAGKDASAIEVNPVADPHLKTIVEESNALCKHLPPADHILRAKALAGIVADWSQESISGEHTMAKSREALKAGKGLYLGKVLQEAMHVLHQDERTCLRAVLFKYLCDENNLTCAMTAAGDCCIGPSATHFSLTRPSLRPSHVQVLAYQKQENEEDEEESIKTK